MATITHPDTAKQCGFQLLNHRSYAVFRTETHQKQNTFLRDMIGLCVAQMNV